jgi:hypothetical protein
VSCFVEGQNFACGFLRSFSEGALRSGLCKREKLGAGKLNETGNRGLFREQGRELIASKHDREQ